MLESPKFSFPQVDYEPDKLPHGLGGSGPQRSPYDLSTSTGNGHAEQPSTSGRHSRVPSFPVVDYEPEHRGGFSSSSQVTRHSRSLAPKLTAWILHALLPSELDRRGQARMLLCLAAAAPWALNIRDAQKLASLHANAPIMQMPSLICGESVFC